VVAANVDTLFIVTSRNAVFDLTGLERYLIVASECGSNAVSSSRAKASASSPKQRRRSTHHGEWRVDRLAGWAGARKAAPSTSVVAIVVVVFLQVLHPRMATADYRVF